MKHRIHITLAAFAMAVAGMGSSAASANPGLLHKHGARPLGVPAMLPGQATTGGAAATSAAPAVVTADAATTSTVAVAGVAPGPNGCVVIVAEGFPVGAASVDGGPAVDPGLLPVCDLPPPVGQGPQNHRGPNVFHRLNPGAIAGDPGSIDAGIVDSGMVMVDGPPLGFVGGAGDVGMVDGAGDMPMVRYETFLPVGPGGDDTGAGFVPQPMNASMASASTADVAGASGRTLAGGLPNRAAGVRTDSITTLRHHGHGPAPKPNGVAVSGDDTSGRVVQAGGVAEDTAVTAPHDRRSKYAVPVAGQAGVPPAATAAPRWRDRLRFAWPTSK
jgi:hypothetical protein